MPINRAPFNLLIDDSGNNANGTPWNKSQISTVLLDPIDAAIQQPAQNQPFNAANFFGVSAGLVWTVGSASYITSRYIITGNMMYWYLYISWFSGASVISGTTGPVIGITIPAGKSAQAAYMPVAYTPVGGVPQISGLIASTNGNTTMQISKSPGNWSSGEVPGFISTFHFEIF